MFFAIFLGSVICSSGQEVLAEIDVSRLAVKYLKGTVVGDSLFLAVRYKEGKAPKPVPGGSRTNNRAFWVSEKGSLKDVDLSMVEDKLLCGIVTAGTKTNYYFFEEAKKAVVLKSLVHDKLSGTTTLINESLNVPGRLLGSYIEGDLYLVCASKSDFTVRVIQVHDLKIVKETIYKITRDLVEDKRSRIAFINENVPARLDDAASFIKIFKQRNFLYIVVDEPFIDFRDMKPPFKTAVSRLDLKTGEVINKIFFEEAYTFSSWVLDNKLYRIILQKKPIINVYDIQTAKLVLSKEIDFKRLWTDEIGYMRYGTNSKVAKKDIAKITNGFGINFIIADSVSADSVALTVGTHINEQAMPVVFLPGLGVLVSAISTFTSLMVNEIQEGPSSNSYFYFTGSPDSGFDHSNNSNLIRQQVDEFELSFNEQMKRIVFKGYLHAPNTVYAFYQEARTDILRIVRFKK